MDVSEDISPEHTRKNRYKGFPGQAGQGGEHILFHMLIAGIAYDDELAKRAATPRGKYDVQILLNGVEVDCLKVTEFLWRNIRANAKEIAQEMVDEHLKEIDMAFDPLREGIEAVTKDFFEKFEIKKDY